MSEKRYINKNKQVNRKFLSFKSNSVLTAVSSLANIFQILLTCKNLKLSSCQSNACPWACVSACTYTENLKDNRLIHIIYSVHINSYKIIFSFNSKCIHLHLFLLLLYVLFIEGVRALVNFSDSFYFGESQSIILLESY